MSKKDKQSESFGIVHSAGLDFCLVTYRLKWLVNPRIWDATYLESVKYYSHTNAEHVLSSDYRKGYWVSCDAYVFTTYLEFNL